MCVCVCVWVCGGGRDALKRSAMAGPTRHLHEMCNRYCIHVHVLIKGVCRKSEIISVHAC